MPIKMGDQTYDKFEDASKSVQQSKGLPKERADAYVATIDRKQNEAEVPEQTQSLTSPNADDVKTEDPQDLTSPQGSSREAENPFASGQGELSPANPAQDKAEPSANPQDQAEPANVGHQGSSEVSQDSDIKKTNAYGKLNGSKHIENEDENKDKRREDHQSLEYNGESYNKVESIEYDGKIYIPRAGEAEDNDLEYDNKFWKEADEDVLELDDDYYVKDAEEQGDIVPNPQSSMPQPTTATSTPQLNPTGESIIIKESNGKYKKYNIFEVHEEELPVQKPAETTEIPTINTPQGNITQNVDKPKEEPIEQKEPVEEVIAVEKIIMKEKGILKFKTVYTEVKKKASENPFEKKSLECLVCPKSVKQFEGWVQRKINILKLKRPAHEGVGLLFGIPTKRPTPTCAGLFNFNIFI